MSWINRKLKANQAQWQPMKSTYKTELSAVQRFQLWLRVREEIELGSGKCEDLKNMPWEYGFGEGWERFGSGECPRGGWRMGVRHYAMDKNVSAGDRERANVKQSLMAGRVRVQLEGGSMQRAKVGIKFGLWQG